MEDKDRILSLTTFVREMMESGQLNDFMALDQGMGLSGFVILSLGDTRVTDVLDSVRKQKKDDGQVNLIILAHDDSSVISLSCSPVRVPQKLPPRINPLVPWDTFIDDMGQDTCISYKGKSYQFDFKSRIEVGDDGEEEDEE